MELQIGECGKYENVADITFAWFNPCKGGKAGEKGGRSVRIRARGTQVIGSSGRREEVGWLCAEISARHCLRVG